MLLNYLMVGLGGACGATSRVAIAKLLPSIIIGIPFPILFINVSGCFLIGFLTSLMNLYWPASPGTKYFLISGFLGGFTTFSSFALELGTLIENDQDISAFLYGLLSFALSMVCFFIGMRLIKLF